MASAFSHGSASGSGTASSPDNSQGLFAAIGAFSAWGFLALYWKSLAGVPAYEQLCYRIVWSVVALVPLIVCTGRARRLFELMRQPALLRRLLCSTLLISANWYLYIWAVSQNRVLDSSLGYYINPLMSTVLGYVVLHERFDRLQGIGIALAAVGVVWGVVGHGALPVLALAMALTFSLYGLVRKMTPVDPICGVCVETLLMLPVALAVLGYRGWQGYALPGGDMQLQLMLAGPFTLLPMLLFTYAAQRVRLMILGLTQYLSPTIAFFLSIFVFHEPFSMRSLGMFVCIWAGLLVFTWASWRMAHPPHSRVRSRSA